MFGSAAKQGQDKTLRQFSEVAKMAPEIQAQVDMGEKSFRIDSRFVINDCACDLK